jgi:DNA repair photolyase
MVSENKIVVTDELFGEMLVKYFDNKTVDVPKDYTCPFGAVEWAEERYNSHWGCPNGCKYCYSRLLAYQKRKKWIVNGTNVYKLYGEKSIRKDNWIKKWRGRKNKHTIMYPSMHDITPKTAEDGFKVMKNIIEPRNVHLLWVTKPYLEVVEKFVDRFEGYKDKIMIRMTITTNSQKEIDYWEPNAPTFEERMESLKLLFRKGYTTSISIEPMLIPIEHSKNSVENELIFVRSLLNYTSGTIWVGMMNHIPKDKYMGRKLTDEEKREYNRIENMYKADNFIERLVKALYREKKVRFKESIKHHMLPKMRSS